MSNSFERNKKPFLGIKQYIYFIVFPLKKNARVTPMAINIRRVYIPYGWQTIVFFEGFNVMTFFSRTLCVARKLAVDTRKRLTFTFVNVFHDAPMYVVHHTAGTPPKFVKRFPLSYSWHRFSTNLKKILYFFLYLFVILKFQKPIILYWYIHIY